MKTLWTRSKTALVFVSVMIAGIYSSLWSYGVLMLLVIVMSLLEFFKLYQADIENSKFKNWYVYVAIAIGLIGFVATFPVTQPYLYNYSFFLLLLTPFLLLILEIFSHSEKPFQNIGLVLLSVCYVALPVWLLNTIVMHNNSYEPFIALGIILLIWCNDAFAYLVGSLIGKHKIIPRITPGKTWEGTIGGIVFNFITAYLISILFGVFSFTQWAVIAAIVSVFATVGDWVESMMKRSLNVKDSGNLLPGHGGMLDRFDAFFFAIPFVAAYIWWLK
jgi:phosphatidate cytidylyltransferase